MRSAVPRRWPAPRPWSGRRRGGGGGGGGGGSWIIRFYKPVPGAPGAFHAPGDLGALDAMGCCHGALLFPSLPSCPFLCRSPPPAPRCKPLSVQPLVRLAQAGARACALALACCAVPPGAPAQEPAPPAPLTTSTPSTAPVPPDLRPPPPFPQQ